MIRRALVLFALAAGWAGFADAAGWPDWADAAVRGLDASRYADADAVILTDEWTLDVRPNERRATRRWVLSVLTGNGARHAAAVLAEGKFAKVAHVKVWSRDARQRTRRYDDDDGTLWGLVDQSTFDENEVLVIRPRNVLPGTVIAMTYDVTFDGSVPQDVFSVQQEHPVALFRLSATTAEGVEALVRVGGAPNPGPEALRGSASWEFRDLPGVASDDERFSFQPPRVRLSVNYRQNGAFPSANWAGVAQWALGLFEQATARAARFEALAAGVKSAERPFDAAGRAARDVRYFGIELGWGGWVPRAPEVTLSRGFGDCKDKALLMADLLRAAGIDAVPVLISSPNRVFVDPDLPAIFTFDHAIAGVPWIGRPVEPGMIVVDSPGIGPLRLFDATLPAGSSQDLSVLHDGAVGLAVDRRTTGTLRVPERGAANNRRSTRCDWHPAGTVDARLDCRLTVTGIERNAFEADSGKIGDAAHVRSVVIETLSDSCPGFTELLVDPLQAEPGGAWIVPFRYRCPHVVTNFGQKSVMLLPDFVAPGFFPMPGLRHSGTVFQPYLRSVVEEYRIEGADRLAGIPAPLSIENDIGSVTLEATSADGVLVVRRTVGAGTRRVEPAASDSVKALRRALGQAGSILLVYQVAPAAGS